MHSKECRVMQTMTVVALSSSSPSQTLVEAVIAVVGTG
jgi:hypothetical protein